LVAENLFISRMSKIASAGSEFTAGFLIYSLGKECDAENVAQHKRPVRFQTGLSPRDGRPRPRFRGVTYFLLFSIGKQSE